MKCKQIFKGKSESFLNLFKALSDRNRLNIFEYFCRCHQEGNLENSVKDVKSCCDIDLSVVSRHLASLKQAGVLNAKKEGKNVFYSLNAKEVAATLRELADSIEQCCSAKKHRSKGDSS